MTDLEKTAVLKQYERMIWKQVYRVNRNRFLSSDDCEELANTFRFNVWKSLDRFDGRASISTWVHNTLNLSGSSFLYHHFKDTVKKVDSHTIPMSAFLRGSSDDDENKSIAALFSYKDESFDMVDIDSVIDSLPSQRYAVMVRDRMNGMTYREIAEKHGVSHQCVQQFMASQREKSRAYV
jgi:RNA polymerase sigma factor (sigma-70 family)